MLTKIMKDQSSTALKVQSLDNRVEVSIEHDGDYPLSKNEVHQALVEAEAVTHEFLAAVEADIEATAH